MKNYYESVKSFFIEDKRSALLWLAVRLYVGWQWFYAGYEKLISHAWLGNNAGIAVKGFLNGALTKTEGAHPDVMGWYAYLINHVFIPIAPVLSYLVVFGEIIIGIALILGLCTKKAAKIGAFMNINYLLAGTVSINPFLLVLQLLLIKASKVSGWNGLDRFIKRK
ncbi:MAG: DoxX family membrane protein [Candidatus Pacebacteria bacterium]|nr:DoxX family membrane protein [Candidatus Paceibacterota bacterium]